jgi:hypothetical protein
VSLLLKRLINQYFVSKAEWVSWVSTDIGQTQDFVFRDALHNCFKLTFSLHLMKVEGRIFPVPQPGLFLLLCLRCMHNWISQFALLSNWFFFLVVGLKR